MTAPAKAKIRLVLADVDGTLLTSEKVLTSQAAMAVKELQTAGIAFAITSGRPPRGMAMLIDPLGLRTPIAGFNGGVFVRPDLSVIESHTLDPAAAKQTLKLILDQGLDAWVYTEADWLIRDQKCVACGARDLDGQVRCQGCGVLYGRRPRKERVAGRSTVSSFVNSRVGISPISPLAAFRSIIRGCVM